MRQLTPRELKAWLDDPGRASPLIVDVREPWEVQLCVLPGTLHVPMGSVPSRQQELDPDVEVVLVCHHGMRSMQVAAFLDRNGFCNTYNLSGGIDAWARDVDPSMPTY